MSGTLNDFFPFEPTPSQAQAIEQLTLFTAGTGSQQLYVLKGYAGTGKTTLISAYIEWLKSMQVSVLLMAPTGRAAKVLSSYSGELASTIHRSIYFYGAVDGVPVFKLQQNKRTNMVVIVDEASMIGNGGGLGTSFQMRERTLLDDLIQFTFSGKDCKIIFVGDVAQLPPVGTPESPALDLQYVKGRYPVLGFGSELTDVTRQALNSGILRHASMIRTKLMENDFELPLFNFSGVTDCRKLMGPEIEEEVSRCYDLVGVDQTVVICRSNKQANAYNKYIRYQIFFFEEELSAGDRLMVVKNNYFWLSEFEKGGFIANGDVIYVNRVISTEEKFGFRFADLSITIEQLGGDPITMEVKVLVDTLHSEVPALSRADSNRLYEEVSRSYLHILDRKTRSEALKKDPYFNAVQVKFAYAITCHKAQGGQWSHVFVDQGYLTEEQIDLSFFRWLYTAVTRASEQLYLLNFDDKFFVETE